MQNGKHIKRIAALACITLCMFVFTACVSGVFAWRDFTQSRINHFGGTVAKTTAILHKYAKAPDGTLSLQVPVPGAQFLLYMQNKDNTWQQISGLYITDEEGEISAEGLTVGKYVFVEQRAPFGYTFDKTPEGTDITEYPFSITDTDVNGSGTPVHVVAYNRQRKGALVVSQSVYNANGDPLRPEQQTKDFEFTALFSDLGVHNYSIDGGPVTPIEHGETFYLQHEEQAVFDSMPAGLFYQSIETPEPDYATLSTNATGNIPENDIAIVQFDNIYHEADPTTGSLEITKVVSSPPDETPPVGEVFDFNVEFSDAAQYEYTQYGVDGEILTATNNTFSLKDGERVIFDNLPVGITYTITELNANENNFTSAKDTITGIVVPSLTQHNINNFYDKTPIEPGNLTITKTVTGAEDTSGTTFLFTVNFTGAGSEAGVFEYTFNGGDAPIQFTNGDTIQLAAGDTVTFANLPAGMQWQVIEGAVPANYLQGGISEKGTISSGGIIYANFINYKIPPPPSTDPSTVTVTKTVLGNVPDYELGREFDFTLRINGGEPQYFKLRGNDASSVFTFTLNPGDSYRVCEENPLQYGYIQNGAHCCTGTVYGEDINVIITNTYVGLETVTISGTKTWDMQGDEAALLPRGIVVELYGNDIFMQNTVVTPNEDGEWLYSFTAPRYNADGTEFVYTVKEQPVDGFITTVDGTDILNTWIKTVTAAPAAVTKVMDPKGETPEHPETFYFRLEPMNNGTPMPNGTIARVKTISVTGEGTANFGDIRFEDAGVFEYHITEVLGHTSGFTYDTSLYMLTVVVEDIGGELVITSTKYEKMSQEWPVGENTEVDGAVFMNKYVPIQAFLPEPISSSSSSSTSSTSSVSSTSTDPGDSSVSSTSSDSSTSTDPGDSSVSSTSSDSSTSTDPGDSSVSSTSSSASSTSTDYSSSNISSGSDYSFIESMDPISSYPSSHDDSSVSYSFIDGVDPYPIYSYPASNNNPDQNTNGDPNASAEGNTNRRGAPQTGDATQMLTYILLAIVLGAILTVIVVSAWRQHRRRKEK